MESDGRGFYSAGANADAFHSVDVAAGPLLEECDFSGEGDEFDPHASTLLRSPPLIASPSLLR